MKTIWKLPFVETQYETNKMLSLITTVGIFFILDASAIFYLPEDIKYWILIPLLIMEGAVIVFSVHFVENKKEESKENENTEYNQTNAAVILGQNAINISGKDAVNLSPNAIVIHGPIVNNQTKAKNP